MKKRLNPTEILLKELPAEGRSYEYNQDSAELTPTLKDLIGHNDYTVRLSIRPIGNAYEVQGDVKTTLNLQCSLCAIDFRFPVDEKFHDVLVIQEPLHKGDQNTRTNHSSEWNSEQPEGIYLEAPHFSLSDFIHEVVALTEPMRPLGRPNCDVACENRTVGLQREWLSLEANAGKTVNNNPFSVLEKLKLKS